MEMVNNTGLIFLVSVFTWIAGLGLGMFYSALSVSFAFASGFSAWLSIAIFLLAIMLLCSLFFGYLTPIVFFFAGLMQGSVFLSGIEVKLIFKELFRAIAIFFAGFIGLSISQAMNFEAKNIEGYDYSYMRINIIRSLIFAIVSAGAYLFLA
jgi:uncharacterized membrane protein AbrB (regulator of aidB expression)